MNEIKAAMSGMLEPELGAVDSVCSSLTNPKVKKSDNETQTTYTWLYGNRGGSVQRNRPILPGKTDDNNKISRNRNSKSLRRFQR